MNVVHMIDSEGMFGAEYVIYHLLPALRKLGVNATLACLSPIDSPGAELGRKLEAKGVPVAYLNEKNKISIRGLTSIYRTLKSSKADILHVHGYKATILGGLVSKLIGIPVFSTYHAEARKHSELSTYLNIEMCFLKNAARIIAVSGGVKRDLIERGIPENRISIVFNGIEDPAVNHNRQPENGFCNILSIGRLVQLKRFDLVLRAVSILRKDFPELRLTIAGSGPLGEELKLLSKGLGIADRVSLPGYVSSTERLFAAADIFILPSETEGAPISVIEAMSFSLPIIASCVGAIPDMLPDSNGNQIHPGDLQQLVEALRKMLSSPQQRRALGIAARRRFEEEFTSMSMASKYMIQYEMSPVKRNDKRTGNRSL